MTPLDQAGQGLADFFCTKNGATGTLLAHSRPATGKPYAMRACRGWGCHVIAMLDRQSLAIIVRLLARYRVKPADFCQIAHRCDTLFFCLYSDTEVIALHYRAVVPYNVVMGRNARKT